MSYKDGNAKLAAILQKRMQGVSSFNESPGLELGEITESNALKIDNFPIDIPSGEYLRCVSVSPGDRVLIAWADGEAVIAGRLMN